METKSSHHHHQHHHERTPNQSDNSSSGSSGVGTDDGYGGMIAAAHNNRRSRSTSKSPDSGINLPPTTSATNTSSPAGPSLKKKGWDRDQRDKNSSERESSAILPEFLPFRNGLGSLIDTDLLRMEGDSDSERSG